MKTLYGDGTHSISVDEETRVVSFEDDKTGGLVELSEAIVGEFFLSWQRWRERRQEGIPEQTVTPDGIDAPEGQVGAP
jgi:hypothetical protein